VFNADFSCISARSWHEINFELDVVSPTFEEYTFIYISYNNNCINTSEIKTNIIIPRFGA
jgi:hypothetical protein